MIGLPNGKLLNKQPHMVGLTSQADHKAIREFTIKNRVSTKDAVAAVKKTVTVSQPCEG
jgi:hypothetical protein